MITRHEIYADGYERGQNIASYQDLPEAGKEYVTDSDGKVTCLDKESAMLIFSAACYEAESMNREYSPFEFTAKALNDLDADDSVTFEVWDAFEEGIQNGIAAEVTARFENLTDADFQVSTEE